MTRAAGDPKGRCRGRPDRARRPTPSLAPPGSQAGPISHSHSAAADCSPYLLPRPDGPAGGPPWRPATGDRRTRTDRAYLHASGRAWTFWARLRSKYRPDRARSTKHAQRPHGPGLAPKGEKGWGSPNSSLMVTLAVVKTPAKKYSAQHGTGSWLELRERVRGLGGPPARRPGPASRRRVDDVVTVRPAGRRHRGDAAGGRGGAAGQGGAVPLQRPRVPRVDVRRVQGRAWSRSTPTTATPTTSSSTCGTTPTPWRSCSTARSPTASTRYPRPAAARSGTWLWVDDGSGPVPRRGRPPYEDAPPRRRPASGVRRGPWGRSGDDLLLLYTGGTTGHAQGRDVAPGRPVRGPRRAPTAIALPRGQDLDDVRDGAAHRSPGPASCPAAPLMHGTGLFTRLSTLMHRRQRRHARPAATSTPTELLDTIER